MTHADSRNKRRCLHPDLSGVQVQRNLLNMKYVTPNKIKNALLIQEILIMEATASIRNVPIAPRKARLVADLVRHQYVEEALNQLTFTHKAASPVIRKLIQSAAANARENAQRQDAAIDETNLFVKQIFINDGVTRKWFRPRARGMVNRILRRRCHITVVLDEEREEDGH